MKSEKLAVFEKNPSASFTGTELEEEELNLAECIDKICKYDETVVKDIEKMECEVREISRKMATAARRNFIIESELDTLDQKIKLLIRNRITVEDVLSDTKRIQPKEASQLSGTISKGTTFTFEDDYLTKHRRDCYEHLFYILQNETKYFALLARVVSSSKIQSFVQTVVFDMYGDQYDSREERLLLSVFQMVLKAEFNDAKDMGSLLRSNSAVTMMLTSYARRGQGLSVLKDVLAEPLQSITAQSDLNLELNPIKVHAGVIRDYETSKGETWPHHKALTADQIVEKHPEVVQLMTKRRQRLFKVAGYILKRITAAADTVPYGMRYICRLLKILARRRFPDANRNQIGSLIGGYVYLRFFNPVIVTPDAINFITKKPSKLMRTNLIMIAKLLQNLSNGNSFGAKEPHMVDCNVFLEEHRETMADYFDRLVDVPDLNHQVKVDKYLERTNRRHNLIHLSFNQIAVIHQLLDENKDKILEPKDPIEELFQRIAADHPPELKKNSEDFQITLELAERFPSISLKTNESKSEASMHSPNPSDMSGAVLHSQLLNEASFLESFSTLRVVLQVLPKSLAEQANSFQSYLQTALNYAQHQERSVALTEQIEALIGKIQQYETEQILPLNSEGKPSWDLFAIGLSQLPERKSQKCLQVEQERLRVQGALKTIEEHETYLESRLELYREYLNNVKRGQAQSAMIVAKTKSETASPSAVAMKNVSAQAAAMVARTGAKRDFRRMLPFRQSAEPEENITSLSLSQPETGLKNSDELANARSFKMSHTELEDAGVITWTDADVRKAVLKRCVYKFKMLNNSEFLVVPKIKKVISLKVLKEPITLQLEELLSMQHDHRSTLEYEYLHLNVNLLIHLLNTRFLAKK